MTMTKRDRLLGCKLYHALRINNNILSLSMFVLFAGQESGQIYTYPAKRWKKKQGPPPEEDEGPLKAKETETGKITDCHSSNKIARSTCL